jgi:hypothetical protein
MPMLLENFFKTTTKNIDKSNDYPNFRESCLTHPMTTYLYIKYLFLSSLIFTSPKKRSTKVIHRDSNSKDLLVSQLPVLLAVALLAISCLSLTFSCKNFNELSI